MIEFTPRDLLVALIMLAIGIWGMSACSKLAIERDAIQEKQELGQSKYEQRKEAFNTSCAEDQVKKIKGKKNKANRQAFCEKEYEEIRLMPQAINDVEPQGFIENVISKSKSTFWFMAHTCKWTKRITWDWPTYLWTKYHWGWAIAYWFFLAVGLVNMLFGKFNQASFDADCQLLATHRQMDISRGTNELLGKLLKKK